jgi:hypothetical protein
MRRIWSAFAALIAIVSTHLQAATIDEVASRGCAAIKSRVTEFPGDAPVFLRSYEDKSGRGAPDQPALRTAAFVYDNSLAVIALIACGEKPSAMRVGEALRLAILDDSRLRNVYRSGEVKEKPLPNGWWDAKSSQWVEDAYQSGTATGNAAWTALAMLALFDATHDARWNQAAAKLGRWVIGNTSDTHGAGGFNGGIEGFDAAPKKVLWKSTEHNIDLIAVFAGLDHAHVAGDWRRAETNARRFVDSQWDSASGHFFIGTQVDGVTPNRDSSALDAQLWAQLISDAPKEWRRALAYVEREHAVPGGFDFNADRDGAWIEGTAQAALVYRVIGRDSDAQKLFATIDAQFSTSGMIYATREAKITTGLATSALGGSTDFYYYRMPHLGATAWAVLSATATNPLNAVAR